MLFAADAVIYADSGVKRKWLHVEHGLHGVH
jgi:hypothetical protein